MRQGIGDDCAVLRSSRQKDILVTTDLFLEGVHFRRNWQEAAAAGHKALARGLSDIAAMGGTPRYAFLSLGLPKNIRQDWVENFLGGLLELAQSARVTLAGGDTGRSSRGLIADIVVVGDVPRNQAVLRCGARPGDEIWVTGNLGLAGHALRCLQQNKKRSASPEALQAFFYPQPRLRTGRVLRKRKLASAMIDLSDGLSIDLARLCQASGVGAEIQEAWLPRAASTPLNCALHGGEDLELLFTVPVERSRLVPKQAGGVRLTRIGRIVARRGLALVQGKKARPLPVRGFEHF